MRRDGDRLQKAELASGRVAAGGMTEALAHSVTTSFASGPHNAGDPFAGRQYGCERSREQEISKLRVNRAVLAFLPMTTTVRPGEEADLEQLNEIYNHYVLTSPVTFDVEPISMDARKEWFGHYAAVGPYRLFVAVDGSRVLGFAGSHPHRARKAYDTSVETTVYVAPDAVGRGVGSALYSALFAALEGQDLHRAYGGITLPNPASIALHERFGFTRAGLFTEQGRKFGRYWDVAWYEKPLS
jgi:phosphinothricin acetyltransferase